MGLHIVIASIFVNSICLLSLEIYKQYERTKEINRIIAIISTKLEIETEKHLREIEEV